MTQTSNNDRTSSADKWDDSEFHQRPQPSWVRRHRRDLLLFSVLGMLLAAVVFWLPALISNAELETPMVAIDSNTQQTGASGQSAAPSGSAGNGNLESPFEQAQITRARRQAQEILAKILDRQSTLEEQNINLWAAEAYAQALKIAATGDEFYTGKQFTQAQQHYEQTLQQLDQLIAEASKVLQNAIEQGSTAITHQQSQPAIAHFQLAVAIDPDSEQARLGLQRAKVLDQVLERVDSASNLMNQDLEAALAYNQQAQALDPESPLVRDQQKQIRDLIRDRDFSLAMGRGLQQLQEKRFQAAIESFSQALDIKPDDDHGRASLSSAREQQRQYNIERNLAQAASLEASESWQQAAALYERTLKLDNSVVSARVGQLRSQARAELDSRIQSAIDSPLRLNDTRVLSETRQLLLEAERVKPQGHRIQQQARQLQSVIAQSQQAVPIRLQSDNATQVTLYRVGQLGAFEQRRLDLKPGRYTLVGNREGYRDVREEFTVNPGATSLSIVIQCTERIALDG